MPPPHEGSLHTRLLVTGTSIIKSSGRDRGSIVGPLAIRIWISKSSLMPFQVPSINYHSFMSSISYMPCLLAPAKILSSRAPRKLATGETVKVSAVKELSLADDLKKKGTIVHLTMKGVSATGTSTVRNESSAMFVSDSALVAGKGVMALFYGNSGGASAAGSMTGTQTVSSFGELNESGNRVRLPVTFSGREFYGWNLGQHPFTSAIHWSSYDITKMNLGSTANHWKPASESSRTISDRMKQNNVR